MPTISPDTQFVIYKGDNVLGVGTPTELAVSLGLPEPYIRQQATPSAYARAIKNADSKQLVVLRVAPEDL